MRRAFRLPPSPPRDRSRGSAAWAAAAIAVALVVATPIAVILGSLAVDTRELWGHLATTVLPIYVRNSLALMVGVGVGSLLLGVGAAWLVVMTRVPLRRMFEIALLLPMAMPAYILAYAYTDFLQAAGPLQSWIRATFDVAVGEYPFPRVRSLGGAVAMLTFALYPYVYLLTRTAFRDQAPSIVEASRSLGRGAWATFLRVALPLARPAVAAGLALVLMETLADFGTVDYFGVSTFTTGIYRTWFGLGERAAAAQLAAILMGFVLVLIVLERNLGRRPDDAPLERRGRPPGRYALTRLQGAAAVVFLSLPIVGGFIAPALILGRLSWRHGGGFAGAVGEYAVNTVTVALVTVFVTLVAAVVLAYAGRLRPTRAVRAGARLASMGYAVPGSVIAVGVLLQLGWLDNRIDLWARDVLGVSTGLLFSGTIAGLVFAYVVRFLAVAYGGLEAGLARVTRSMDDAARSLGWRQWGTLIRVHLPLLRGSLLTAGILVFVDVAKELPATLIVRPFNFDTLAARVYRLASDERLVEAAPGALTIGLLGLLPVLVLAVTLRR